MTSVSDIEITPLSGLTHIDALLDVGPDWNYLTPAGNTILYTFSISSGNEAGQSGQQAFDISQQMATRTAMAYISELTGIVFTETVIGSAAQVHFSYIDIDGSNTSGLCSWRTTYQPDSSGTQVLEYEAQAYIYLDNAEFGAQNRDLRVGTAAYETLLHELGHMLGLKHPFDEGVQLPVAEDLRANTLMSYDNSGTPFSTFRPYDVAALNWLYGGDGLAGALGIGSLSGARYITGIGTADILTGSAANDVLDGAGGDDRLAGGAGQDTAVFLGLDSAYLVMQLDDGRVQVSGPDGTDTLESIELLRFDNGTFAIADMVDLSAPAAPVQGVEHNAANYVRGNTPQVSGSAEAHATIKVFIGDKLVGSGAADASGAWTLALVPLGEGSHQIFSTATDASGNVSAASSTLSFLVDTIAPSAPVGQVSKDGNGLVSGNQPAFVGNGEAGTMLGLVDQSGARIGQTEIGANGLWSLVPHALVDGHYSLTIESSDAAGNIGSSAAPLTFSVQSVLNRTGGEGNDVLSGGAGNNAFDGGAGIDTVVYAGPRASHTVTRVPDGYRVDSGANGIDFLRGVERIEFADAAVAIDIDGNGGQAYRIYQAAFDRVPDLEGLGYWMLTMDQGVSLQQVASGFIGSAEFVDRFGSNLTNLEFASLLYKNVLHRAPDAGGVAFWVNGLDKGLAREEVLIGFSESTENQAQLIGTIEHGFEYVAFG